MINKIIAILLIFLLFPIFIIVSALILIEDGFPVFFIQKRVGMNKKYFSIYKFRSMNKSTPNVATHLLDNPNKYLLKTGKFIRKLSIDELPNLFNIITGDMVFVGPRPALFNQKDLISLREENGVNKLKPGITGWAQINGRDELSIINKVSLDVEYLKRKSLFFDLSIIVKTIIKTLNSRGVSH